MPLLSSLLFGLAASLDAFLVGITYGIRNIHITLRQNLLISLITLLGTCLSVLLGSLLLPLLPASIARLAGSSILILLGLYYLLKSMLGSLKIYQKPEEICDCVTTEAATKPLHKDNSEATTRSSCQDTPKATTKPSPENPLEAAPPVPPNSFAQASINTSATTLTLAEACILGITLSLNNMGIGLSASITGLPLLPTSVITLLFSIAFLMAGNRLGCCRLLQLTKKAADPVSGLLLIILGICQFTL